MNKDQIRFVEELKTISHTIAMWAENQFLTGCSVSDIKRKLKQLSNLAER